MRVIALVVVENEIEKLELAAVFRGDTPIEKCAERVALHEAVKKPTNLSGLPHKFALDRR